MALKTIVQIEGDVPWQVARDPRSGEWIGVCRLLNLNAVGDTWAEMSECAAEAMMALFIDLFESGELTDFLRRNGWRPATSLPAHDGEDVQFDMPFHLEQAASVRDLIPQYA